MSLISFWQLSAALLSPPSGFLPAAGAAGEAGLDGATSINLCSPLPPQACVMAPVSSAVISTSVVSATFDGVLYQQGMCPEVPSRQLTSGWVPEGAAPVPEVGVGSNYTAVTQVVGMSFPHLRERALRPRPNLGIPGEAWFFLPRHRQSGWAETVPLQKVMLIVWAIPCQSSLRV